MSGTNSQGPNLTRVVTALGDLVRASSLCQQTLYYGLANFATPDGNLPLTGGTMTNGIAFASGYGASNVDLSHHLAFYATTYGIGITANRQNYVVPSGASHRFIVGSSDTLTISTGTVTVSGSLSVSGSFSSGSFSTGSLTCSSLSVSGSLTCGSLSATNGATFGGALVAPNGLYAYMLKGTSGANYFGLWMDSGNQTVVSAGPGGYVRFVNSANTVQMASLDTIGNFTVTGGVTTAAVAANGNIQAGTASGGYLCKSASNGAFSTHVFNFQWDGTYLYSYIDTVFIGSVQMISDERYKHQIRDMQDGALERVMQLRPLTYRLRDKRVFRDDGRTREGFSAQDMQTVIPAAVAGADPLTLDTTPILAVLTKAVQELTARVAELEARHG